MANLRAAVAIIEEAASVPGRRHRRATLGRALVIAGGVLACVAFYLYTASKLLIAWQTGGDAWHTFWANPLYGAFGYGIALLALAANSNSLYPLHDQIIAACDAALADGAAQVPLAAQQPTPATDASPATPDDPIVHHIITPLVRPRRLRDNGVTILAWCLYGAVFFLALAVFILFLTWISVNPGAPLAMLILLGVMACCLAAGYSMLRWGRRTDRPIQVIVDDQGLRWRESTGFRRERHIAWDEARVFLTFSWRSNSTYTNYQIFALIAPSAVFTWQVTQRSTLGEQRAHMELAGLIAAHTGLPLRDLTRELAAAAVLPTAATRPKIRFPLGKPGTPDAVPGVPPVSTDPVPPEVAARARRQQIRLRVLLGAVITPLLLLNGAGLYVQHVQPGVFAAYLARAEAQRPLYRDSLSWFDADIDWQATNSGKPTGYDPYHEAEYTYTHTTTGGVVFQTVTTYAANDGECVCPIGLAWDSRFFSNAVVEATVDQSSYVGNDTPSTGIIFRSSSDGNIVMVFSVDQSGFWYIDEYQDYPFGEDMFSDSGSSDVIHVGDGATNRLAVIMRGDQFLCFVNGSFVGGFTDSHARAAGVIGLYTPGGVQFSNLAVYPLPASAPPLLWDQ